MHIEIPARDNTPKTTLYTQLLTDGNSLGERDVVILIPGGPGNDHSMYDSPEQSIAKTFLNVVDVILFDPRGCGQSQQSAVEFCSMDHYIDDIEAIRVHFNIAPEKFVVFGQSYGSLAATAYAIKYPDNLKKLLLIGGVASSEFREQAQASLEEIGTPAQKYFAEKIWQGTCSKDEVDDFYKAMSPLYSYSYVEQADAPLAISYNIDILNYGWGHFLKHFDFRPDLHKIKCQTLILWGENEWIMNRQQIDELHHGIKPSQLIIYQQCSHMLWIDQWDRFVHDALHFLK